MRVIIAIASAAALCAPVMARQQRTMPDIALAGPTPANYRENIKAWLDAHLKDPSSAQIEEVRGPRAASHQVDRGFLGKLWDEPAWWVCYRINAKNSYGGFVGNHLYMFGFVGGTIQRGAISPEIGYQGREYDVPEVEQECRTPIGSGS